MKIIRLIFPQFVLSKNHMCIFLTFSSFISKISFAKKKKIVRLEPIDYIIKFKLILKKSFY